jgi:hypothetical protein
MSIKQSKIMAADFAKTLKLLPDFFTRNGGEVR